MGDYDLYEGCWVRIGSSDDGSTGTVESVDDPDAPYRVWVRGTDGHQYIVPATLLSPIDHPLIKKIADEILFLLEVYNPAWKQVDTYEMRRAVVFKVISVLGVDIDALSQRR